MEFFVAAKNTNLKTAIHMAEVSVLNLIGPFFSFSYSFIVHTVILLHAYKAAPNSRTALLESTSPTSSRYMLHNGPSFLYVYSSEML